MLRCVGCVSVLRCVRCECVRCECAEVNVWCVWCGVCVCVC